MNWEDVPVGGKKLHLMSLQRGGPLSMHATGMSLPHWHAHTSCLKYTVPIKYSFFPPTGMGKVTAGKYRKGYPLPLNHSFPLGGPLTWQWTNGSPHHDHGHDEGSACPPQHHPWIVLNADPNMSKSPSVLTGY